MLRCVWHDVTQGLGNGPCFLSLAKTGICTDSLLWPWEYVKCVCVHFEYHMHLSLVLGKIVHLFLESFDR